MCAKEGNIVSNEKKPLNKKLIVMIAVVLAVVIIVSVVLVVKNKREKDEETATETKTIAETTVSDIGENTINQEKITTTKQVVTEKQKVLNTDFALYIKDNYLFLTAYPTGKTIRLAKNTEKLSYYTAISQKKDKIYYLDEVKEIDYDTLGTLYYRDLKNLDKAPVKIAENVDYFDLLEDGSLAYYVGKSDNNTLYWTDLNETERIGNNVHDFKYSEKHKTFFYRNGALYSKRLGEKAEKLHDDVWSFKLLDNDESCYFYVFEGDSSLTLYKKTFGKDKIKIDSGVYSDHFMYRDVFCADGCGYYYKGENIYYYNGKTPRLISKDGSMCATTYNVTSMLYTESSKTYIALGDKVLDITNIVGEDKEDSACDLKVRKNGEIYIFNILMDNYDMNKAELYTCTYDAKSDRLVKGELLLDEIYIYNSIVLGGEEHFITWKNIKDDFCSAENYEQMSRTGDLYVGAELISKAVNIYRIHFDTKTQTSLYFTDWNTSTKEGTLKINNKNGEKIIAKDVSYFQFTTEGNVIYLKGDRLYMYSKGKSIELVKGVDSLWPFYHSHSCVSLM